MTPDELSQLRLYAIHLRGMVSREERLGTERSKLPSWKDTKRLLLNWAEELDQEANDGDRRGA